MSELTDEVKSYGRAEFLRGLWYGIAYTILFSFYVVGGMTLYLLVVP